MGDRGQYTTAFAEHLLTRPLKPEYSRDERKVTLGRPHITVGTIAIPHRFVEPE